MWDLWLQGIFGVVACEALVQLWFDAAPLQPVRRVLIWMTPFLKARDTHLFQCKYCTSVWIAIILTLLLALNEGIYNFVTTILSIHRLSNYLHLVFSLMRDRQIDLRIKRNAGKRTLDV